MKVLATIVLAMLDFGHVAKVWPMGLLRALLANIQINHLFCNSFGVQNLNDPTNCSMSWTRHSESWFYLFVVMLVMLNLVQSGNYSFFWNEPCNVIGINYINVLCWIIYSFSNIIFTIITLPMVTYRD